MSQSRWTAPLAIATLLALSACTGGGDATTDPTPATSAPVTAAPSPSPSPTPSPPMPTHAPKTSPTPTPSTRAEEPRPVPGQGFDRNDAFGAQVATGYMVEVLSYTLETGNEEPLDEVAIPELCTICDTVRTTAQDWHRGATAIDGGHTSFEFLKAYSFDSSHGGYPLDIRVSRDDSRLLGPTGALLSTEPGFVRDFRIELLHDGSTWRLINMFELEEHQ